MNKWSMSIGRGVAKSKNIERSKDGKERHGEGYFLIVIEYCFINIYFLLIHVPSFSTF